MEFSCSRGILFDTLAMVAGVVKKNPPLPVLSNVLLKADAEGGRLHLSATDLEVGVSCNIPAQVSAGGELTLPARKLTDIALFHCVSSYPAPYEESNLRAIATMRDYFRLPVGYSDHSPGLHIAIAAIGVGALLLEKHFTVDRGLPGPDQALSLMPSELHSFVTAVRQAERAMGNGVKEPQECEVNVRQSARKSLVTTRTVKRKEKFKADMITTKRPATGIEPRYAKKVIGRRAKCDIAADTILTWDMV